MNMKKQARKARRMQRKNRGNVNYGIPEIIQAKPKQGGFLKFRTPSLEG